MAAEIEFVARCRRVRERRGISQRELARRLTDAGIPLHQSSIAKLERDGEDRRPLLLSEAVALSRILVVPLWDLLLPPDEPDTARMHELSQRFAEVQLRYSEVVRERHQVQLEQIEQLEQLGVPLALVPPIARIRTFRAEADRG